MQARMPNPAMTRNTFFDFATLSAPERYKLLVSTVVPRPIAWIVTLDPDGQLNAAPFSFFNAFASNPPVVGIGIGSHEADRPKDTRRNIQDTKQFVVNLVSEEMAQAMNITAISFEPGVSELSEAGLDTRPSIHIKPPRIAGSPVAMECELIQIVDLGTETGLVLGRVLAMHVREDAVIDVTKHSIDTPKLGLIGRMHGSWYTHTLPICFEWTVSPATNGGLIRMIHLLEGFRADLSATINPIERNGTETDDYAGVFSVRARSNLAANGSKALVGPFHFSSSTSVNKSISVLSVAIFLKSRALSHSRRSVAARALALVALTCHSPASFGMDSRCRNFANTAADDFAPHPDSPG